jgi:beta-lactam-binding protein with PASTA domain
MTKKQSSFFFSRTFLINILLLLALFVLAFVGITAWLSSYTHHGESIEVPDLRGKKISALDGILKEHNFHYKVVDSIYDAEKVPGSVLDQDPAPKSKVKENRTLYLTVNAIQPPDVKMPDLVDVSYRQAEAMLQSFGLITGEVTYRSDLAKNAVLEQRFKGKIIKPGTMIPKGSEIDLVLGDGLGNIQIPVPDLMGMTKAEAGSVLRRESLSLGVVQYDHGADSATAKIYRQNPVADGDKTLRQGDGVDVYLK